MKKTYVKPEVYFESFELSANIASGCAFITKTHAEVSNCSYNDGVDVIFMSTTHGCVTEVVDGNNGGKICYHVSADEKRLFTS